ncbi:MAG: hypothetical protein V3T58_01840 [Candidatus Hydrothermarchaeales archaeon]
MTQIEEFDEALERSWRNGVKKDVQAVTRYYGFHEVDLVNSLYYHLRNRLTKSGIWKNIQVEAFGIFFVTKKRKEVQPDMLIYKTHGYKPWVAFEFKRFEGTPQRARIDADIVKLAHLKEKEKITRAYMVWVASRKPERRQIKQNTHSKKVDKILKEAKYLKICYGFFEEEDWGILDFPFKTYPYPL